MLWLKGSERAATAVTPRSLLLSLVLLSAALLSEASETNKHVSLLFLNALDDWESTCTSHTGKVFGSCAELGDYDTGDSNCNPIITCVEEKLKSRLSHFPKEVENQIGNIKSRLCQNVGNEDISTEIMECVDSKKSAIKECLEKQADDYCDWKKKNDSRTIYTEQYKKLTKSISSCVLDRVSKCSQATVGFFTGVFDALKEDSTSSGTPTFTLTKTLSFLAVIFAFTFSLL